MADRSNGKEEVCIFDAFGKVLKRHEVPRGKYSFEAVEWSGVHLYGAQLGGANFEGAVLYCAGLFDAHLDGANFKSANLQGADLKNASCVGADFSNANLLKDNLGGRTQLQGCDLTAASFAGAQLQEAEYDAQTIFPEGFKPDEHGMRLRPIAT